MNQIYLLYCQCHKHRDWLLVLLAEKIGIVFYHQCQEQKKMLFTMRNVPVVEEIDPVLAQ